MGGQFYAHKLFLASDTPPPHGIGNGSHSAVAWWGGFMI